MPSWRKIGWCSDGGHAGVVWQKRPHQYPGGFTWILEICVFHTVLSQLGSSAAASPGLHPPPLHNTHILVPVCYCINRRDIIRWWLTAVAANLSWHCPLNPQLHPLHCSWAKIRPCYHNLTEKRDTACLRRSHLSNKAGSPSSISCLSSIVL